MNYVALVMAVFSALGAVDRIFGNRFGLGKEFERGLKMFGTLALSMIGMIVMAPMIADLLQPALNAMAQVLPIDPSIVPASLFANDMGGAPLAVEMANDPAIGAFNGLVVASMMGCTVSFTIPFALGTVNREQHKEVLLGLLCGIITIPVGCFAAGLVAGIPILALLLDLLPLVLFSLLIALGLWKAPGICVKIFNVFGVIMKVLITIGLAIGIFTFLTGIELLPGAEPFENAAMIVVNAAVVLTGAFPLIYLISKALKKPLAACGKRIGVNETSMTGFLSCLAASMTTFDMMRDMDKKGVVLNAAFAVSAAFTFADHMAYTLAFREEYLWSVIVGKLIAGVLAVLVVLPVYRHVYKEKAEVSVTAND